MPAYNAMPMDKTVDIDLQQIDPLEALFILLFVFNLRFIQQIFVVIFFMENKHDDLVVTMFNTLFGFSLICFYCTNIASNQSTNQPMCAFLFVSVSQKCKRCKHHHFSSLSFIINIFHFWGVNIFSISISKNRSIFGKHGVG